MNDDLHSVALILFAVVYTAYFFTLLIATLNRKVFKKINLIAVNSERRYAKFTSILLWLNGRRLKRIKRQWMASPYIGDYSKYVRLDNFEVNKVSTVNSGFCIVGGNGLGKTFLANRMFETIQNPKKNSSVDYLFPHHFNLNQLVPFYISGKDLSNDLSQKKFFDVLGLNIASKKPVFRRWIARRILNNNKGCVIVDDLYNTNRVKAHSIVRNLLKYVKGNKYIICINPNECDYGEVKSILINSVSVELVFKTLKKSDINKYILEKYRDSEVLNKIQSESNTFFDLYLKTPLLCDLFYAAFKKGGFPAVGMSMNVANTSVEPLYYGFVLLFSMLKEDRGSLEWISRVAFRALFYNQTYFELGDSIPNKTKFFEQFQRFIEPNSRISNSNISVESAYNFRNPKYTQMLAALHLFLNPAECQEAVRISKYEPYGLEVFNMLEKMRTSGLYTQ